MPRKVTDTQPTLSRNEMMQRLQANAAARVDRVYEHDARENARAVRIARKLLENPLTMQDLMGGMDGVQLSRSDVMLPDMQLPQRRMLTEEYPIDAADNVIMEAPKPAPTATWRVRKYLGETRSGNKIPVWKVGNTQTGLMMDKLFKLEEVAIKVAHILNQTGNMNDPRLVSLISTYDTRDKLLREIRQMEKPAAGKPMKTQLVESKKAELARLDYKLGI